jgi:hypothetical protein
MSSHPSVSSLVVLFKPGPCDRAFFASAPRRRAVRPSYNRSLLTSRLSMEAERLNQIEGTVADLRGRLAELRRYL